VSYFIDWGDDTNTGWIGPYTSGDQITESHTWSTKGTYMVKAKAKDPFGNESDWATLRVTMPYSFNKPVIHFLELLFQRFLQCVPDTTTANGILKESPSGYSGLMGDGVSAYMYEKKGHDAAVIFFVNNNALSYRSGFNGFQLLRELFFQKTCKLSRGLGE